MSYNCEKMHTILHGYNSATARSHSSLWAARNLQGAVLRVIADELNETLFLPCGGSGFFKLLEEGSDGGKRATAEIKLAKY